MGLYGKIINPGRYTVPAVGVKIWDSTGKLVADTSKDGQINAEDALVILKYAAGIISKI